MYPTLLDTKTGKTAIASDTDRSVFWWSEGNGSCDCNRALCIGEDVVNELEEQFGTNVCCGCTRIVAIDVHGDLEGLTKEEVLENLNSDYPENLRKFWEKP